MNHRIPMDNTTYHDRVSQLLTQHAMSALQVLVMYIQADGVTSTIQAMIFACLRSWLKTGEVTAMQLAETPLLSCTFDALQDEELFDTAVDVLCDLINETQELEENQGVIEWLLPRIESLRPALDLAAATGRGVFALALTSNPEGRSVQHAVLDGRSVAASIAAGAAGDNAAARSRGELGSVGLVVGATVGAAVHDLGIDLAAVGGPILAPGFGAQGGHPETARAVFGDALPSVLASSSREVLRHGPDVGALARAVTAHADELAAAFGVA